MNRLLRRLIDKEVNRRLKEIEENQDRELVELNKKSADKRIKKAFIAGGVQYFEFEDINNILCGRAFAARDFFAEMSMKVDREYLLKHCEKVDEILSSKTINIGQLGQLNMQMKERLELIISPETVYKCASVVYFDKTESPFGFDYKYSFEKIASWKKLGVSDFFLLQPLRKLIPSLDISDEDLKIYIQVGKKMEEEHLRVLDSISTT